MLKQSIRIVSGTAGAFGLLATPIVATATPFAPQIDRAAPQRPARVRLAGDVFVERFQPAPGGGMARVLERADALHSGDRLVFVVSWNGADPAGFTVTNPVPRSVVFQPALGNSSEEVSVDGGRSFGRLETLMLRDPRGQWRHANAEDITHVRWRVPATRAAGGTGQITYRGIVR